MCVWVGKGVCVCVGGWVGKGVCVCVCVGKGVCVCVCVWGWVRVCVCECGGESKSTYIVINYFGTSCYTPHTVPPTQILYWLTPP